MSISDETLMAYVDGELDAAARTEVDTYLKSSPEARQRLEIFQTTGRGLSELFDQPMRESVPQRLLDAVIASDNVVPFGSARRRKSAIAESYWPAALAACLAVLAAGGSAYWYEHAGGRLDRNFGVEVAADGRRVASKAVATVLDGIAAGIGTSTTISGQPAKIEPVFTFATEDKSYCRQYIITTGQSEAVGGVACRSADGQWQVEAQDTFDPAPDKVGQIAPAGGNGGPPEVEAAVDQMIAGDVLKPDAEAALIAGGWRSAPQ